MSYSKSLNVPAVPVPDVVEVDEAAVRPIEVASNLTILGYGPLEVVSGPIP